MKSFFSKLRCSWVNENPLMIQYHDIEWGTPVHDDTKLFELLVLEGAQAGLSWNTVLNKRQNYRDAFENFNVSAISNYNQEKIDELLQNASIIRNKLKINSVITNAKAFIEVQKEFTTFDTFIWQFVHNKPVQHTIKTSADFVSRTEISDKMSKELLKRGFKFVGSTICYAFMQATGMTNDHLSSCFRYKEIKTIT